MPVPKRCGRRTRTGGPCRNWCIEGADVCRMHGGSAPQVRAAAARRVGRERLNGDLGQLLAELELEAADKNPAQLLLDAVHRCDAMVRVLGELVGRLRTDQGPAGGWGGIYGPDHLGDLESHPLILLYGQWLDRATRASKLALDAGVDERLVRIAEAQGQLVAEAFRDFARRLGHDPGAPEVRAAARAALTSVREPVDVPETPPGRNRLPPRPQAPPPMLPTPSTPVNG